MAVSLQTNQTLPLSIEFDDAAGTAISPPPAPDALPTWSVPDAAVATLAVAADGLSAVLTPVAVGTASLGLTVIVKSVTFTASLSVDVVAAPVIVASVKIVAGTPTP